ncbi:MAG: 3-dehydroquinate synthase [Alistipes sp.]|nr:3-dehydroquinate synthase [Alistipes sp.]
MSDIVKISDNSTLYIGRVADLLDSVLPKGRVIVITDVNIDRLYPDLVHRYEHIVIGSGEAIKSLHTVEMIYDRLRAMGADRSTFLLGIGGGIVTDITGFVAATYMRGVEFGFISTSLLGQVDASIGGKNGVNVADYKNMVGTFLQPRFVISDVEMLRTLPRREFRAGMAEAVKSAIVGDAELFAHIEEHAGDALYSDVELLKRVVYGSVAVKSVIVAEDEREAGRRRVLNLGHTIAHAIEKSTHELNHGEAVAVGISMISHASVRMGIMVEECAERIDAVLQRLGFELRLPIPLSAVLREVRYDKKKKDNILRVVVPESIGCCRVVDMPFDEFEKLFVQL